MHHSKIVRQLRSLSSAELNEFGRYMHTEFFNRKERLRKLVEVLSVFVKGKQTGLEKAEVYQKLFPEERNEFRKLSVKAKEKHLRKRMDMLIYELKIHLEDYLVWKQSRKKGYVREMLLLEAYNEREADTFYFDLYDKLKLNLEKQDPKPISNHYLRHVLVRDVIEHPGYRSWPNNGYGLKEVQEQLDIYYLANKLMNSWLLLLADSMINRRSEVLMLDEMLRFADMPPFKGNLYIDIYSSAIRDLRGKNFTREGLENLKKRILPGLLKRPRKEQIGLFNVLTNYTVLWWQFNQDILKEIPFELNLIGLENGYYQRRGVISYADFHNITCAATNAGKLEWAENFVNEYGTALPEKIRHHTVIYQKARIKHEGGKHREALNMLSEKPIFTNSADKILERLLRIRCYYELEENELLENILESTRKQIERNPDFGPAAKDQIRNFVRITMRLCIARQTASPIQAAKSVWDELQQAKLCAAQDWLIRQVQKLLNN
ncbi:MAG TPA: hypothetical protein ENJ82_17490 [Bacteroidetes bacterium]|nr:hypothetical protein [Bacteroidota bacterium]